MADVSPLDFHLPAAAGCVAPQTQVIQLQRGKVIRLEKSTGVKSVEVSGGVIWLTGTPANGDVVLSTNERFELRENWPFVIQALEAAELLFKHSF